jgi:hypothetical protein
MKCEVRLGSLLELMIHILLILLKIQIIWMFLWKELQLPLVELRLSRVLRNSDKDG